MASRCPINLPHHSIYAGDFNSYHGNWRHMTNDNNSEAVIEGAEELACTSFLRLKTEIISDQQQGTESPTLI